MLKTVNTVVTTVNSQRKGVPNSWSGYSKTTRTKIVVVVVVVVVAVVLCVLGMVFSAKVMLLF